MKNFRCPVDNSDHHHTFILLPNLSRPASSHNITIIVYNGLLFTREMSEIPNKPYPTSLEKPWMDNTSNV